MADEADIAQDYAERLIADGLARVPRTIPVGVAGECEHCGNDSPRLIGGACAPCRMRHKLP